MGAEGSYFSRLILGSDALGLRPTSDAHLTPTLIMSLSPPIRRLSTASQREEALIYQYEAEEERIINVLSRKLEQLQDEKGMYFSCSGGSSRKANFTILS